MEIREVEKRFDARLKSYDPSKRVGAGSSFNPDRFVEVKEDKFNPEVRVNQGGVKPDKLGDTLSIMKLISTLNQFGEVEIFGTNDNEGKIQGIAFADGGYDVYVDLTNFPSVEIGKEKYFAEKSGVGVLELALYIIRKTIYINRLMGGNKWSSHGLLNLAIEIIAHIDHLKIYNIKKLR